MARMSKKEYEDICKNEEYNPKGFVRLICLLTTIVIVLIILVIIF